MRKAGLGIEKKEKFFVIPANTIRMILFAIHIAGGVMGVALQSECYQHWNAINTDEVKIE